MRTVIVGGGLVGLTTAASLRLIGHDVLVLERAPRLRATGASIGLWPNASREFRRIGIDGDVRRMGEERDTRFFDAAGRPVRTAGHSSADHRFLLVPRSGLTSLLAATVGRGRVRWGARVTGFREHDTHVAVRLGDGEELEADLLIGADGVRSGIRALLVPGSEAVGHAGHHAWRAVVPSANERPEGTVLTVGSDRSRGGYARVAEGRTMWMVNQFAAGELVGTKRDRALRRAHNLAERGWHDDLLEMIARTPEEAIVESQVMLVPELPRWTTGRVALIGDAAHALSPHIAAGGTLGIEDVGVLRTELAAGSDPASALARYESSRAARFDQVRELSASVEQADGPAEFADRHTAFSRWMLTTAPAT